MAKSSFRADMHRKHATKSKWIIGAAVGVGAVAIGGIVWAMTRKSASSVMPAASIPVSNTSTDSAVSAPVDPVLSGMCELAPALLEAVHKFENWIMEESEEQKTAIRICKDWYAIAQHYCVTAPSPGSAAYSDAQGSIEKLRAVLSAAQSGDPNQMTPFDQLAGFSGLGINLPPIQVMSGLGVGLHRQRVNARNYGYPGGAVQLPATYRGWQYR